MIARIAATIAIAAALAGCRDQRARPSEGKVVIAPVADPRPRPAEVAHLTLKVLGMT